MREDPTSMDEALAEIARLKKRTHEIAASKDREMASLQAFRDASLSRVAYVRAEWERRGEKWMLGLSSTMVSMMTEMLRQRNEAIEAKTIAEREVAELARMLRLADKRIERQRAAQVCPRCGQKLGERSHGPGFCSPREHPLSLDTLGPLPSQTWPG